MSSGFGKQFSQRRICLKTNHIQAQKKDACRFSGTECHCGPGGASRLPAHEPQPIAGGVVEVLTEAQVALGGLDGGVAERNLDLLKRGLVLVGELGEGVAIIPRTQ